MYLRKMILRPSFPNSKVFNAPSKERDKHDTQYRLSAALLKTIIDLRTKSAVIPTAVNFKNSFFVLAWKKELPLFSLASPYQFVFSCFPPVSFYLTMFMIHACLFKTKRNKTMLPFLYIWWLCLKFAVSIFFRAN